LYNIRYHKGLYQPTIGLRVTYNLGAENKEARPRWELTNQENTDTGGNEWDGQSTLSHAKMVERTRDFIQEHQKRPLFISKGEWQPQKPEIILRHAMRGLQNYNMNADTQNEEAYKFFLTLEHAWDALAHDRYPVGTFYDFGAGGSLATYYRENKTPIIKLNSNQAKLIDAMAEAVGIPRQRGQSEVVIPEHLRDYSKWRKSPAYKRRLARAEVRYRARDKKSNN
jgi:hypothetical protein